MIKVIFVNCTSSVVLIFLDKMTLLDERIQIATALLSLSHYFLSRVKENLFPTQNDVKTHYEDCVFTREFSI